MDRFASQARRRSLVSRLRTGGLTASLLLSAVLSGCGEDLGPAVEQPIDGQWELVGLFALDVRGFVQCTMTGSLSLQQLPGGVNTIVGDGSADFDCMVDGEPETWDESGTLMNSRLIANEISARFAGCHFIGTYERGRPELISDGRSFCRMSFIPTGLIDVAGTWEAHREITP